MYYGLGGQRRLVFRPRLATTPIFGGAGDDFLPVGRRAMIVFDGGDGNDTAVGRCGVMITSHGGGLANDKLSGGFGRDRLYRRRRQ